MTNNEWGISTPARTQHGEKHIADRGKAFGMQTADIDGNDPEVAYRELQKAMEYVRTERKPFLLEAMVSRLYGHSSASGANFITEEADPLAEIEKRLEERAILTRAADGRAPREAHAGAARGEKRVREEPQPHGKHIWNHVFAEPDARDGRTGEGTGRNVDASFKPCASRCTSGETRLGVTDIFGEDVGPPLGGVFTATQGLKTAWNSPLDERGIVGAAIGPGAGGAAARRGDPVLRLRVQHDRSAEARRRDAAGRRTALGNCPMVLMTPVGSGIRGSIYHSHSFDAQATRLPGWKIVMPSTPLDAYGLMLSAIVDPNPVMFLAPKALMRAKARPGRAHPRRAGRRQAAVAR